MYLEEIWKKFGHQYIVLSFVGSKILVYQFEALPSSNKTVTRKFVDIWYVTTARKTEYYFRSLGTLPPLPLRTDVVCLLEFILFLVTTILIHCGKHGKGPANGLLPQAMPANPHSSCQIIT